jgi:DNA repair exonuclease SbcCD nuclease subunit
MNCLVIGDPHFKVNNKEETDLMSTNTILYAEKIKPHFIVCLGDVLDRHETIHISPLLRSVDFLIKLSSISPTYVLIGNHDRPNNNIYMTDEHPFSALKGRDNIFIVDKTLQQNINNYNFLFVPYVPPGRFNDALENIDLNNINTIFAHQEFQGAKMGAIKSTIGDKWDINLPLVISGHIHDFDVLQENIIYVGTPIQHSFSDDSNKGIFLFTFDNKKFIYEKYDLGLPKKKIIRLNCNEHHKINKLDPKHYNKIILTGTPEEIKLLKLNDFILPRAKFVFKTISSTKLPNEVENYHTKGFINIFIEKIKDNPDLISTFNNLFQLDQQ